MWDAIKKGFIGLIGSKKVVSLVIGGLAMLAIRFLGFDDATATDLSTKVITVFMILIGAQGLTDLGKGDDGRPYTLLEALKQVAVGLLSSRKFQTAMVGVVVLILVKYLKVGDAFANQLANGLFGMLATLLGAQGLTDLAKTT